MLISMKSLERGPDGTQILKSAEPTVVSTKMEIPVIVEEEHSPIVTTVNMPMNLPKPKIVVSTKARLPKHELTEEKLLQQMIQAGGKNLTTSMFATAIAPPCKRSVDALKHDVWDLALIAVRHMMRQLVKKGKVKEEVDTTSKKVVYLYSVV